MILLSEDECRRGVGIPFEIQQKLRSGDFAFISEMGRQIQLEEQVMCTANYMVNLFFVRRSYLNYERYFVCTAALMLAGKVHNFKKQNKRVYARDYVVVANNIWSRRQSTGSGQVSMDDTTKTEHLRKLFKAEYKLLKTLEFDLEIDLPVHYIREIIEKIYQGVEEPKLQVLASMARVMANESMRSIAPLCLPTLAVAVGSVILGSVMCQLPAPTELINLRQPEWWLEVSDSLQLDDINSAMRLILEAIDPNSR